MRKALLACAVLLAACGGPGARSPQGARGDLPKAYAAALRVDATGDPLDAVKGYLAVVDSAVRADGDPWQVAAIEASLDALATRVMPSLGDGAADASLAWRTRDGGAIAGELARDESNARGAFARGLIARALTSMAQRQGDAVEAERQRVASGCAREALVVGPTTWAPITGVDEPGPLDGADARIEASYATGSAFATAAHPVVVSGRGCALDLSGERTGAGVREVVVDVDVPQEQTIGLALRAHGAALLRAGGTRILRRPFELGDGEAARFARVHVTPGTLRVVARVGTAREDDSVEIDAFGEDGAPLRGHAPAVGSAAAGRVLGVSTLEPCACHGTDELILAAAAALSSGDAREAEQMLWGKATRTDAAPELALLYGRAVASARDLSPATRAERARSAYERVLEAWPASWEAAIEHAVLAGVRRGHEEAGVEMLRDLDSVRARMGAARPAMLDAFEALTGGRERLFDRARAALERARGPLAATAILADAEDAASPRAGTDLTAARCDPARVTAHDTLACFDALRSSGDRARATDELARLRALLGAPSRYLAVELREALAAGDAAAANRAFGAMLPAERTLAALAALDLSPDVRAHLLRAAAEARDAPAAIAPLLRAVADDPTREFEGVADKLVAQDRASPILPSAATAVLAHLERYDVGPSGLLRWLLFDVRRVSGTTDVEENAQAAAPDVWGRGAMRALRRRIFKRDGRVLEPDQTPRASQAHADLSQLEQGDTVEAIYEGWSLPGDTGDVGIDTPDLLPDRTAVHDATIELRLPRNLHGALWSHALLGKPVERADGEVRVLTWHVVDHGVRRVEDGVPKMDRSAGVSFSTAQWAGVARALRETIAALGEHDPEIAAWAREAAGHDAAGQPTAATVEAVVTAAGKALRESDPGTLSDYGGGIAAVQTQTARSFLTSHDGSRSWLVLRSLQELGVPSDVVVAESDPFSADPAFPPHFGRFIHPLVVAHVQDQGAPRDVWIDADVEGPPLPAGRVSPELRGRLALGTDGTIAPLPALGGDGERDEVDVRLALDAHGDARGTFAVVLRGRDAQQLAEALFRIVGAERQRALRDVVLAWLPWANVDDVQLASSEGSWQVSLRADVSVSGYAQLEGAKTWLLPGLDTLHWAWPRARVSSLGATFATRAGRESALALSTAVQYHLHRRLELPRGATVARMPGPLDVKAKLVEASRRIAVAPVPGSALVITDDFLLGIATGTIPQADYDAFVGVAHAADDGFLASTRVTLP
ncbi:MAG TPA: hypothetical protein VIF15_03140 [Polyangiaceae bacterium]|jgi:hypothetical protein